MYIKLTRIACHKKVDDHDFKRNTVYINPAIIATFERMTREVHYEKQKDPFSFDETVIWTLDGRFQIFVEETPEKILELIALKSQVG